MKIIKKIIGSFLISLPFIAILIACYIKKGMEGVAVFWIAMLIAIVIAAVIGIGIYLVDD